MRTDSHFIYIIVLTLQDKERGELCDLVLHTDGYVDRIYHPHYIVNSKEEEVLLLHYKNKKLQIPHLDLTNTITSEWETFK